MAIYSVTDTTTNETTTVDNLKDLFEANKTDGYTYETFVDELLKSKLVQSNLKVKIEEVDPLDALKSIKAELKAITEKQKATKLMLQKATASALAEVKSDAKAKENVEKILKTSSQSAKNVPGWFEKKTVAKKEVPAVITHVTLPEHVTKALETIAKS